MSGIEQWHYTFVPHGTTGENDYFLVVGDAEYFTSCLFSHPFAREAAVAVEYHGTFIIGDFVYIFHHAVHKGRYTYHHVDEFVDIGLRLVILKDVVVSFFGNLFWAFLMEYDLFEHFAATHKSRAPTLIVDSEYNFSLWEALFEHLYKVGTRRVVEHKDILVAVGDMFAQHVAYLGTMATPVSAKHIGQCNLFTERAFVFGHFACVGV